MYSKIIMLSRKDSLELLFWIPIGVLSLASIYLYQGPEAEAEANHDHAEAGATASATATPRSGFCNFELVENTTITNNNGELSKVHRYIVLQLLDSDKGGYSPISVLRWAELLSSDDDEHFQDCMLPFLNILANDPMDAYFFETKGVNYRDSQRIPFEFVLVESSYLYDFADAQQDPDTFSKPMGKCRDDASQENNVGCVFFSLGGDSILIAPTQIDTSNTNIYGHLAAFVRRAPKDQILKFWKFVMQTYAERLRLVGKEGNGPLYLSTDGKGVAWLHVRLDPRPKYYDYAPFATSGYGL